MERIGYGTLKKLCSTSTEEVYAAFDAVYAKYSRLVYYVCFDLLHNEEEAKDATNETFLKMYEKRRDFMSESKLKYFLLVCAKNLSLNRLKQLRNRLDYPEEDVEGETDVDRLPLYLEKFKDLLEPEEYRYLVLHLLYGFTFREIGKSEGRTTSQVSSKYRRGIEKLRAYYGGNIA